jgi:hypothetical protein
MSIAYIWGYKVHPITAYGDQLVYNVYYFHVLLPGLHRVAPDAKKERRLKMLFSKLIVACYLLIHRQWCLIFLQITALS